MASLRVLTRNKGTTTLAGLAVFVYFLCVVKFVCVCVGGRSGLQQSGGAARGDHVLVGGMGQVDSMHSYLWRRSDVTGASLPQTEVSQSARQAKISQKWTHLQPCLILFVVFYIQSAVKVGFGLRSPQRGKLLASNKLPDFSTVSSS